MLRIQRAETLGGILTHDAMKVVLDHMSVWDTVLLRAVSKELHDSLLLRHHVMCSWKNAKNNVQERAFPFLFVCRETKKGTFKKMILLGRILFGKNYYYWHKNLDMLTSEADADNAQGEPVLSSAIKKGGILSVIL